MPPSQCDIIIWGLPEENPHLLNYLTQWWNYSADSEFSTSLDAGVGKKDNLIRQADY